MAVCIIFHVGYRQRLYVGVTVGAVWYWAMVIGLRRVDGVSKDALFLLAVYRRVLCNGMRCARGRIVLVSVLILFYV